jgi:cell division protein FtsB
MRRADFAGRLVAFVRTRRALALGIVAVAALFAPFAVQITSASLEEWRLDRRLAQVSRERKQLIEERRRLNDDPTYVEGLIRSTFKLAKPGEIVIPLPSSASSD